MKKDNALKQAARWVAKTFGYKSETRFGKIVWRVFAASASAITLIFTVILVCEVVDWAGRVHHVRKCRREKDAPTYLHKYGNSYVSPYIVHHNDYDSGYLYDMQQRRRILTGITWICESDDGDSLTFFSNGKKRGYFNRFTGKVVIPAQYDKAWVFSEGVACVMEKNQIQVIDHSGKPLLDKPFAFTPRIDTYCFHKGLCPMMGNNECIGLIDKQGHWVVEPKYKDIDQQEEGFWKIYDSVWNEGLLFPDGREFLPCEYSNIYFNDNIFVTTLKHLDKVYDYEGNLVNSCNFRRIEPLSYETDEYVFDEYDGITERKEASAHLRKYMSSDYYYGLIDTDGNIITLPSYRDIEAVSADRYLCFGPEGAAILNDKGEECGKKP